MKLPALIALVGLTQYGIFLSSSQPVGQRMPADVMPVTGQKSTEQNDSEARQFRGNIEIQRKLVIATIALVVVGVLQALFLGWQAVALFRTLRAIDRQVDIMIKIERPWILASMEQMTRTEFIGGRDVILGRCALKNVGKSPAWVTSWTAKAKDVEMDVLDPEPDYGNMKGSIPQVLSPGESLSSLLPWLPQKFNQAHEDKLFLYVFGFVSYKDGFGDPHETRFCFRYYPALSDNKVQGFHVAGPPAYNRQT